MKRWIKTRIPSVFLLWSSQHFADGSPHGFGMGATAPGIKHRHENIVGKTGPSSHASSSMRETTVPRRPRETSRRSRVHHVPIPNQSSRVRMTIFGFALVIRLLSCVWLCDPMDCSTPGFPALHYLLETAQTHVHWVGDAIQPSHPLSPSSPSAFNLSQPQGLF